MVEERVKERVYDGVKEEREGFWKGGWNGERRSGCREGGWKEGFGGGHSQAATQREGAVGQIGRQHSRNKKGGNSVRKLIALDLHQIGESK